MDELPYFHRCLYIFGIRRYMDYATGITGIKREISYKSLAEETYVKPRRGVNTNNNSRDQVKRALVILEKAGLISRQSIVTKDEKQLILKCLLAETDNCVQNKAAPWPPHSPALKAAPENKVKEKPEKHYKNSSDILGAYTEEKSESRPESRPTDFQEPARHPVSGKYLSNLILSSESYPQGSLRQAFYDLLNARKYGMDAMIHPQTGSMLQVWESKGVTTEDLKVGMEFADAKNEGSPRYPVFYKNFVLSAMKARSEATEEINKPEVKHERRQAAYQPKESSVQRVRRRLAELAEADGYDPNNLPD